MGIATGGAFADMRKYAATVGRLLNGYTLDVERTDSHPFVVRQLDTAGRYVDTIYCGKSAESTFDFLYGMETALKIVGR